MIEVEILAQAGGLLALLVFWHFVSDWIFQSHSEAMAKPIDDWVRAKHCATYTALMFPLLALMGLGVLQCVYGAWLLFFSHFIEDSYYPILLWAKHIRRSPEFKRVGTSIYDPVDGSIRKYTDTDAFIAFAHTPLGKILMITVDQLVHIAFLIPIVIMALA